MMLRFSLLAALTLMALGFSSCKPDYMGPAAHQEPSGPQIEKSAHGPEGTVGEQPATVPPESQQPGTRAAPSPTPSRK
jgi:hypothetical protein